MRLLVVQLSDIHIRGSGDPLLARKSKIVDALRSCELAVDACVLVFSGDIAFSGADAEYSIAYDFIEDLRRETMRLFHNETVVSVVIIPGNHDCDFGGPQLARDALRSRFSGDAAPEIDRSIVEICTDVQRSFFELRETVAPVGGSDTKNRLFWEYRISAVGETAVIYCLNTAWLSSLKEMPSTLFFPVDSLPNRDASATLAISLLHHPFHWLTPSNGRDVRRRLEQISDIIFTGHEHTHSRRTQVVSTGEVNEFIEGGALQLLDRPEESTFNVLSVTTEERRQQFLRFEWNGEMYVPSVRSDWEAFQVNRLRAQKDFELTTDFEGFLEDPGAYFEKAGRGRPHLSEIFVFPELREISLKRRDVSTTIRGEDVFDETLSTKNLLITAAEQAGKSCLAKVVFSRLRTKGFVPIYIDGALFNPQSGRRLHEQLHRTFGNQYNSEEAEKFRQLEIGRRAIIVDNFHKIRLRSGAAEAFLNSLEEFACRVILFANDLVHAFDEILRASEVIEERATYTHYRILPLGYLKRVELTTKWYMLPGNVEEAVLARQLTDAEEKMNVVLGKNFVPAYPIFVLSMLQGLDSTAQVDVNASTYGYFYEILIKTALATNSSKAAFDIRLTYLTRLAFQLFSAERADITDGEMRAFHAAYEAEFAVARPYQEFVDDLVQRRVLVRISDVYEFKYRYIYYYFVARFLERNIGKADVRELIVRLSNDLSEEENANILLFLAHLSGDPIVIDEVVRSAKEQFVDCEPARLEEDVAFLSDLIQVAPEFEYEEGDFQDKRRSLAARRDESDRRQEEEEKDLGKTAEFEIIQTALKRHIAAVKTVQILGQILKNFPGSLEAERKELIAVECYRLAFRALGSIVELVKEGREILVRQVADTIREDNPDEDVEKVIRKANSVVFGLALVAAHGIVKRVSLAVGSPELTLTYQKVSEALPSVLTRLVNMSVRLDQVAGFPRGDIIRFGEDLQENKLGISVLKWMVWAHVNLFPVHFDDKQKVFSALDIKYTSSVGVRPGRRLLGPAKKP